MTIVNDKTTFIIIIINQSIRETQKRSISIPNIVPPPPQTPFPLSLLSVSESNLRRDNNNNIPKGPLPSPFSFCPLLMVQKLKMSSLNYRSVNLDDKLKKELFESTFEFQ